jgi:predicted metalloendopeptidase
VVNAFYTSAKNQISKKNIFSNFSYSQILVFLAFPGGILQMPFFNKDAPK